MLLFLKTILSKGKAPSKVEIMLEDIFLDRFVHREWCGLALGEMI